LPKQFNGTSTIHPGGSRCSSAREDIEKSRIFRGLMSIL
jgi:hypothetical protein